VGGGELAIAQVDQRLDVLDQAPVELVAEEERGRAELAQRAVAARVVEVGVRRERVADAVEVELRERRQRSVDAAVDDERRLVAREQVDADVAVAERCLDAVDARGDLRHSPVNSGSRFSRKAAIPSALSRVVKQ
jgi:hypothetical protein